MRKTGYVRRLGFLLLLLSAPTGSVLADGNDKIAGHAKMDQHMHEMMAVKERVPAEYRVMERTPIIPAAESLRRGEELYLKSCALCHGNKGDGKGPAAAALSTPPANFLDKHHSGMYNPGEKYWIIGNGSGATGMPAFPDISPVDRWHLTNYILFLQQSKTLK